ncbi:MAG TPA: TRAP transporter substrate-binding protein [Burkholderiaceae bacterium]|nr:TRAP transporter substrate-binding protein [Burkholderiaceae bacterium]
MSIRSWSFALGVTAACLSAAALPVQAQTVLTISSWAPVTHGLNKDFLLPWSQQIEKETEGRVKFRFLPKAVSNPPGSFDAVRDGLADISYISHSHLANRFPLVKFLNLPLLSDSATARSVAAWRVYTKHFGQFDEHKGVKLLTIHAHGPGMVFTARKPVTQASDIVGQKIRVSGGISLEMAEALGASPVVKPPTEAFELLSGGVVDGIFFPAESVTAFKLTGALKYMTTVPGGLYADTHAVFMNPKKFDSLSKEDQATIDKYAGEAMARMAGQAWDKADQAAMHDLKSAGIEETRADAAFLDEVRTRTAALRDAWIATANARGVSGEKILEEFAREAGGAQ